MRSNTASSAETLLMLKCLRLPSSARAPRNLSLLLLLRSNFARGIFRESKSETYHQVNLSSGHWTGSRECDHSLAKAQPSNGACTFSAIAPPHICSRFCFGNVPAHLIEWELEAGGEEEDAGIFPTGTPADMQVQPRGKMCTC